MTQQHDDIAEALEGIRRTGPLTPSRVVKTAKHPDSILHALFEWDDAKAAHEHRLSQARRLIATRVTRIEASGSVLSAYIHVPAPTGEGEYLPIQSIVQQPEKLALARDAALRALDSAQANVDEIDKAVELFGKPNRAPEQHARAQRARVLIQDAHAQLVGI